MSHVGRRLPSLVTEDALLCELACLIAEPGCDRQRMHPDTLIPTGTAARRQQRRRPPILTTFIALQDVDLTMGPTIMVPTTHLDETHDSLNRYSVEERDQILTQGKVLEPIPQLLKEGEGTMMNSRVWHAGGANVSSKRRILFYLSWLSPGGYSRGSTLSIQPKLVQCRTLNDFL